MIMDNPMLDFLKEDFMAYFFFNELSYNTPYKLKVKDIFRVTNILDKHMDKITLGRHEKSKLPKGDHFITKFGHVYSLLICEVLDEYEEFYKGQKILLDVPADSFRRKIQHLISKKKKVYKFINIKKPYNAVITLVKNSKDPTKQSRNYSILDINLEVDEE